MAAAACSDVTYITKRGCINKDSISSIVLFRCNDMDWIAVHSSSRHIHIYNDSMLFPLVTVKLLFCISSFKIYISKDKDNIYYINIIICSRKGSLYSYTIPCSTEELSSQTKSKTSFSFEPSQQQWYSSHKGKRTIERSTLSENKIIKKIKGFDGVSHEIQRNDNDNNNDNKMFITELLLKHDIKDAQLLLLPRGNEYILYNNNQNNNQNICVKYSFDCTYKEILSSSSSSSLNNNYITTSFAVCTDELDLNAFTFSKDDVYVMSMPFMKALSVEYKFYDLYDGARLLFQGDSEGRVTISVHNILIISNSNMNIHNICIHNMCNKIIKILPIITTPSLFQVNGLLIISRDGLISFVTYCNNRIKITGPLSLNHSLCISDALLIGTSLVLLSLGKVYVVEIMKIIENDNINIYKQKQLNNNNNQNNNIIYEKYYMNNNFVLLDIPISYKVHYIERKSYSSRELLLLLNNGRIMQCTLHQTNHQTNEEEKRANGLTAKDINILRFDSFLHGGTAYMLRNLLIQMNDSLIIKKQQEFQSQELNWKIKQSQIFLEMNNNIDIDINMNSLIHHQSTVIFPILIKLSINKNHQNNHQIKIDPNLSSFIVEYTITETKIRLSESNKQHSSIRNVSIPLILPQIACISQNTPLLLESSIQLDLNIFISMNINIRVDHKFTKQWPTTLNKETKIIEGHNARLVSFYPCKENTQACFTVLTKCRYETYDLLDILMFNARIDKESGVEQQEDNDDKSLNEENNIYHSDCASWIKPLSTYNHHNNQLIEIKTNKLYQFQVPIISYILNQQQQQHKLSDMIIFGRNCYDFWTNIIGKSNHKYTTENNHSLSIELYCDTISKIYPMYKQCRINIDLTMHISSNKNNKNMKEEKTVILMVKVYDMPIWLYIIVRAMIIRRILHMIEKDNNRTSSIIMQELTKNMNVILDNIEKQSIVYNTMRDKVYNIMKYEGIQQCEESKEILKEFEKIYLDSMREKFMLM